MLKLMSKQELKKELKPGEIEAFRLIDQSGKVAPYTEEQIDAGLARYNEQAGDDGHEAPLVIDHDDVDPKNAGPHKGPAFGWAKSFRRAGAHVFALMRDVPDEAKKWAKTSLKKRSMTWYENWGGKDGELMPRDIAMLGADIPQIKGMAAAQFNDNDDTLTIGTQVVTDPFALLDEESERDVHTNEGGSLDDNAGEGTTVRGFSEAALKAAIQSAVTAATKPLADRIASLESTGQASANETFEKRIKSFSEGLVTNAIVEPAKVEDEVAMARSLRGSIIKRDGKEVDAAEAYMDKRLQDKPTFALGEASIGHIRSFGESAVLGEDGKTFRPEIPADATPEQRAEFKAVASIARENKLPWGDAQIEYERRQLNGSAR